MRRAAGGWDGAPLYRPSEETSALEGTKPSKASPQCTPALEMMMAMQMSTMKTYRARIVIPVRQTDAPAGTGDGVRTRIAMMSSKSMTGLPSRGFRTARRMRTSAPVSRTPA